MQVSVVFAVDVWLMHNVIVIGTGSSPRAELHSSKSYDVLKHRDKGFGPTPGLNPPGTPNAMSQSLNRSPGTLLNMVLPCVEPSWSCGAHVPGTLRDDPWTARNGSRSNFHYAMPTKLVANRVDSVLPVARRPVTPEITIKLGG